MEIAGEKFRAPAKPLAAGILKCAHFLPRAMCGLAFAFLIGGVPDVDAVDLNELADKVDELVEELFAEDARASMAEGDYAAARAKYLWLAERGNLSAQHGLGAIYEQGQGVARDYERAIKWYYLAAVRGYAPAQSKLANLYFLGRGAPPSNVLAYAWWSLAATQGDDAARLERDQVAELMSPDQITAAQEIVRHRAGRYGRRR